MEFLHNVFGTLLLLAVLGFILRRVYLVVTEASRVAKSTMTLPQYLKAYPQCKTAHGIRCAACNSGSIKNWGFSGPTDTRRVFICNQCNSRLYRAGDW
ncbi:TPA: hypothetical protein ACGJWA_004217 [Pseudomonas aeruginosa]|uniref:hypothetical protein n=1 Tax=Pseudomonas aeruginosa TaxID=287 RepID=UPI00053E098D|nr:hypothetical protein [Pseudomonas aeruginosa]MBG4396793.1 hypothetical protein [Pseudomonas aeruginosa]MDG3820821.1 hypothetical protein [Pseudomonas aeruginosa]HBN9879240.1 hypothetical protein [Pseudomonas aeruginosa]HBN9880041.1 hypothetical protein [Pseudomonas aeruginosa]HBO1241446.1 hypothetical protein [Pseudomonas aeruginosa]